MGRPRIKDFDLPPRMQRRGNSYYYVAQKRWIPLGKDLAKAKRQWADMECLGIGSTVRELVWSYFDAKVSGGKASTVKQYKSFANAIEREWGTLAVDRLTRVMIARYRDRSGIGKVTGNGIISYLRVAYRWAMERDDDLTNPAEDVAFNETKVRPRYLEDHEFRAIWAEAPRWMRTAMDIAYLTGMRPGDVLRLRWDMIGERIGTRAEKTGLKQAFRLPQALLDVLEEAKKRPILGLYVVANEKGRRISLRRWQDAMQDVREKVGIEDATPRDIRAKAGTDAEAEGEDYQALLGHTSKRMSDQYLKNKRTVIAPTLKRLIR